MEFTEEFAVLQGSFMLIERSNVYCDAKSLSVDLELVSDAINDIVDGLSKPHDVSEQELWRLKIHSVMFVKWLENCHDTPLPKSDRNNQVDKKEWSKEDVNDFGNFQEKYFVNSVCVVPTIPTQFYTELLKTLGWSRYLFQCLMRVNCETAIVLIEHLFLYLSKEDSNTKFLVELLECVCNYCRSNSHVELLPTFLSQLLKAIQNRHPDMLKTNIFKILVKFLDDLTKHGVINDASSDEILQDCLARNAKQQSYSMERKKMSDDLPSFLKSQTLILEILISFLSENIFVDCEDSFTVLLSDGCQSMNPVIRSLVELFQRIETCGQFDKAVVTKIATLQTRIPCTLHPVCQSLNESAVIRDEVEILENKLTDVIWRIDERLTGYRAAMDWLLSCKELWFDTRWIQCVSNNLPSIATVRSVTMVIDILHNIDNKSSLFEHLKLVLLQCHASLPLSSQNILRDYLIDEYGLPTLYEKYSPDDFSQQLTTVFNKLVNVEENIDFMQ
ncbi:uncharacterized protein LOC100372476, partial [Saccoglossus kowalevskii]|uniref:Uncharacterized protein LOC100372476 n=1 Tax=Saccoglossus kowalevskii TaxID=10224 RepID=A0ABM0GT25_SACKO